VENPTPQSVVQVPADLPPEQLLRPAQFVLLTVCTLGFYLPWWQYRMWRFLKLRYGLPVRPAARAILNAFLPVYVLPLYLGLLGQAQERGQEPDFSPVLFSFGYIFLFFAPQFLPVGVVGGIAVPLLMLGLLCTPLIPLLGVHRFLVETDGIPSEEARLLHRSDWKILGVVALVALVMVALVLAGFEFPGIPLETAPTTAPTTP